LPRLLLLTPSELSRDPRARRAAAAARKRGFDVIGLCGQATGEDAVPLDGVRITRVGRRGRSNIRWEYSARSRPERLAARELRGLYRATRFLLRTGQLWRAGAALGRFDVVHANDLDTLAAGWLLGRSRRTRLVYDAHELYSAFEPEPPRLYHAFTSWLEQALARRAHAVVTVSEPIASELRNRLGLLEDPIVVLNAPELDVNGQQATNSAGPLRVVYQGAFGSGRPPGDLLTAIDRAPEAHLTIRVVRVPREALQAEIDARNLADRVTVADPLPPDGLVEGLRGFDAGIIIQRPLTLNNELSLPNKLFEYLMAGLAVVAPRLPGLGPLIEEEGIGLTFDPERPEELGAALEQLGRSRDRLADMRRRALLLAVNRFNAEAQAGGLARAWGVS
jgi:glycogen synthase